MIGCTECVGCNNLENVSYYIENKQYTKEEYLQKKQQILSNIPEYQNTHFQAEKPYIINSTHCTGNDIVNCHNVSNIYGSLNVKGGNNVIYVGSQEENENFFDVFMAGRSDNFYGVARAGTYSSHGYCSYHFHKSQNLYYCAELESCSYCLGCIGLRNKSFCILNKQYTKQEWHQKVDEIFSQMEKEGILGNFFPGRMNPYYFNDTVAYLIDPSFTKEEVEAQGYLWRDEPIKVDIPEGVQTVRTTELDQFESFNESGERNISDEILKKVIIDESGNAYRVIPMELEFLRKYELPLPRKHWLERLKGHFKVK